MKKIVVLAMALALGGCGAPGGLSTALEYERVANYVQMNDDMYVVMRHPSKQKVVVTQNNDSVMHVAMVKLVTIGMVETQSPQDAHKAAARAFLDHEGKQACAITAGRELVEPFYEFEYVCT